MNQKASKKACINPNYSLTSERMGKTEVNKSDCYTSSWQSVLEKDKKGKGGAQRTQGQDESHWVLVLDPGSHPRFSFYWKMESANP